MSSPDQEKRYYPALIPGDINAEMGRIFLIGNSEELFKRNRLSKVLS